MQTHTAKRVAAKDAAELVSTSQRIPRELYARLEAERQRRSALVGVQVGRNGFVNALLAERLDALDAELKLMR